MEYSAPQIAGREEPFHSAIREHLKGHTEGLEDLAIEMLARGLSVRDIEDAFKDEAGRLLLSKTAVLSGVVSLRENSALIDPPVRSAV